AHRDDKLHLQRANRRPDDKPATPPLIAVPPPLTSLTLLRQTSVRIDGGDI
ncbi:uncharacterized, partial [Tachysurus ichikawai]